MMDAFKLGRIYKGEEYTMSLPLPFSGSVDNFQLYFFTDSASTVDVPYSSLSISGNVADIEFSDTDLDVLHDGVLCYYLKYSIGTVDYIQSTNTMHYLKTPDGYSGRTAEDIYEEGYHDGVEAAGGDYTDGYNDGIDYQKSKLTSIEITDNGDYTNADGYSAVTVNVPQTGGTFVGETKNYNLTSNGTTTITPDAGYDGITGGTITVDVPQTGHTDAEITAAYNSGYTAGEADGEVTGAAAQKALLVTTAITQNGVYTRENGYSSVNVQVPSSSPVLQNKTVTPTTSQQTVTKDTGYDGLGNVTVNAVTSSIDSDISSQNIRQGVDILGVTGALTTDGCYIWTGTQAQYDALQTYNNNTVYLIVQ